MARIHKKARIIPANIKRDRLMENTLFNRDIISIKDLPLEEIDLILSTALKFKSKKNSKTLTNKIVAHCFFEPSTRTRLSFETATLRLGGNVIGFDSDKGLSTQKGESLHDSIRIISSYADLIVIRHAKEGAAQLAADIADIPVINAGDGANQHPTQALLDLFTIQECQGRMTELAIALVGDLKFSRTIHSFAQACMPFNIRLFLVSADDFTLPEAICDDLTPT
jgi:aspartate carbamoyltransferase catalytic subunit